MTPRRVARTSNVWTAHVRGTCECETRCSEARKARRSRANRDLERLQRRIMWYCEFQTHLFQHRKAACLSYVRYEVRFALKVYAYSCKVACVFDAGVTLLFSTNLRCFT